MAEHLTSSCHVFQPSIGCCTHSKAGWNTLFSCFQPFWLILYIFNYFLDIFSCFLDEILPKKSKTAKKGPTLVCAQESKAGQNIPQPVANILEDYKVTKVKSNLPLSSWQLCWQNEVSSYFLCFIFVFLPCQLYQT